MREGNTQGTLGYTQLPRGTTAQRPVANNGMMRYNTDYAQMEIYANSAWANVATAPGVIGNFLPLIGGTLTGQLFLPTGNAAAPSLSFSSDTTTGIYSPASNTVAMVSGANSLVVQSNTLAPSFLFNSVDGISLPSGATTDRPTSLANGTIRWNTTLAGWEFYDGAWDTIRYASLIGYDAVASEQMLFVYDTSRAKFLSTHAMTIQFQSASMATDDYIYPGAVGFTVDVGTIMPYPGTVVGMTVYVGNVNKSTRNFSIYIDAVENANVLSFGDNTTNGTVPMTRALSNININFNAGQKISMRSHLVSGTAGNKWSGVNLVLFIKWRN